MKTKIFNTLLFTLLTVTTLFAQKAGNIILAVTQQEPTCSRYSDGSITITPSGGVAPYQYIWSTGDTTMTIDSLLAGNYSVTVIDANSQVSAAFITLIDPLPIFVVGTSQNTPIGQSTGLIDITDVTNAVGSWTWTWASNNGFICNQSSLDQSGLPTGNYKIIITDQNGCMGIGYYSINSYFQPQINPAFKLKPLINSTSAISTFPNPSNGNFTVEVKEPVDFLRIINTTNGEEVFNKTEMNESFDINNLKKGQYIIYTTVGEVTQIERISVL